MTLSVKHYSNSGGACTNRDDKGEEEKRNVAILNRKWPGCFRANPKRKNEVIMKWKGSGNANNDDEDDESDTTALPTQKKEGARRNGVASVRKTLLKKKSSLKRGSKKR